MATSITNRKMDRLYEGLSERERVRMMAKLAREHKPDEMNRLGTATPPEHAETYNRALKLLRTLNGNTLDWIGLSRLGMERDRFRVLAFAREAAHKWLQGSHLHDVWKLVPYPVIESEYRKLVERERAELWELEEYAQYLAETADSFDRLRPELDATLESLSSELEPDYSQLPEDSTEWHKLYDTPEYKAVVQQETYRDQTITQHIRSMLDAAITRGELPKPKKKAGKLCLPKGVLQDWATGTTPETYDPLGPSYFVPALDLFKADFAKWDIRPDSEAEAVKERRREMLEVFLSLSDAPQDDRDTIESLDPPATAAALKRARKQADELRDSWYGDTSLAALVLDAAMSHAEHRAQLEGLGEAIAIIQRDDFYGEDPLFPEIRAHLEAAQAEAERFRTAWESVGRGAGLRAELRTLQGLEAYPNASMWEPAPMPTKEPDTDEMLALIRGWGE